jgi:hypothetical protein
MKSVSSRRRSHDLDEQLEVDKVKVFVDALKDRFVL